MQNLLRLIFRKNAEAHKANRELADFYWDYSSIVKYKGQWLIVRRTGSEYHVVQLGKTQAQAYSTIARY